MWSAVFASCGSRNRGTCRHEWCYGRSVERNETEVKVGDIYEDCAYHPVLCTESDGDDVAGISLFDYSRPRSCSIQHCGVRVLTVDEAVFKLERRDQWLEAERKWRETEDGGVYNDLLQVEYDHHVASSGASS